MKGRATKTYGFSAPAHWQRCLHFGFDTPSDDGMRLAPLLGRQARRMQNSQVSAVAADIFGEPVWREGPGVAWNDEFGIKHGPFDAGEPLSTSPRLIVDRHWIWAFAAGTVVRYDRQTLEKDAVFPIETLSKTDAAMVIDIAPDGKCGLWCLLCAGQKAALVRIDCAGRLSAGPSLPPEVVDATEIALLERGATIALLAPADRRIFLIDTAKGSLNRAIYLGMLDCDLRSARMTGDGGGSLALGVYASRGTSRQWQLYLFDPPGEIVQGPVSPEFLGAGSASVEPIDFALGGGRLWIASAQGLWQVDKTEASGSEKSTAELLTPVLHSPPVDGAKGWQQAEIEIDLPEGASLEVSFLATDDPRIADEINQLAANESLPRKTRIASIWALLGGDAKAPRRYVTSGGPQFSGRVEVPLFLASEAFLLLRMKIDLPPLVRSPTLRSMRILYPEHSLMRYLPAVFSGEEGDPDGVLRRLLGVAEATSRKLDEKIASIGRMIEAETAPEEWLDYLGSWLDLPWHDALHPNSKRLILRAAGDLLAWRGTRRGVIRLLECLSGPEAAITVDDVMADHSAIVLGGNGIPGAPIRGLLVGLRRDAPTLGRRAILGRARLGCEGDDRNPIDILEPWIGIAIEGPVEYRAKNEPHLAHVLAQYLPAGLRHSSQWRVADGRDRDDPYALVLDAREPGTLGRNVEIGRTTLAGRDRTQIGSGVGMGFQMR